MNQDSSVLGKFTDAALGYGGSPVIEGVNLEIILGDFIGIVGPNGSGKTTLLRTLLGRMSPLAGGLKWPREGLRFGYVPQISTLSRDFPVSVLEVVLMGTYKEIGIGRRVSQVVRQAALEALNQTGMANFVKKDFRELSGGQQQRVLIARALVGRPDILVLDEPTMGIDLASEKRIMDLVQRLHSDKRHTIIMATHLLTVVANYAKKIGIIEAGRLRFGPTREMLTSESLSEIYGIPVAAHEVEQHYLIYPRTNKG